ncbi:hypothetical protein SAMN04488024_10219 [Pedobacter soli]|uniref:Uncharacterized protein n=1 Tax=Pedobacter soli TaxID=390242 RepID=A0A1G6LFP2_9SPHI|nr:hypothetical protein SAMN04488024_10219 [Pedobacter soli]
MLMILSKPLITFVVKEYLFDTCLTAQDNYKTVLGYFEIDLE